MQSRSASHVKLQRVCRNRMGLFLAHGSRNQRNQSRHPRQCSNHEMPGRMIMRLALQLCVQLPVHWQGMTRMDSNTSFTMDGKSQSRIQGLQSRIMSSGVWGSSRTRS